MNHGVSVDTLVPRSSPQLPSTGDTAPPVEVDPPSVRIAVGPRWSATLRSGQISVRSLTAEHSVWSNPKDSTRGGIKDRPARHTATRLTRALGSSVSPGRGDAEMTLIAQVGSVDTASRMPTVNHVRHRPLRAHGILDFAFKHGQLLET